MKTSSEHRRFKAKFDAQFEKAFYSSKKRDRQFVEAIRRAVDKILQYPLKSDTFGKHGPIKYKRKLYVGKNMYRIAFLSCYECRQNGWADHNACEFCQETDEYTVVFFMAGRKKDRHSDYCT